MRPDEKMKPENDCLFLTAQYHQRKMLLVNVCEGMNIDCC